MVYFPDETYRQQLRDLIADGPMFPLVEATQVLLHQLGAWPDLQGMLGDFSQNARHVRGFPRKDVSVGVEEANERAFLFGGKRGANAHRFALGATGVYENLLGALYRLERPSQSLGVRRFFDDLLPDYRKLFGGNNLRGVFIALNLALIGMLEGGANGDDPMRT